MPFVLGRKTRFTVLRISGLWPCSTTRRKRSASTRFWRICSDWFSTILGRMLGLLTTLFRGRKKRLNLLILSFIWNLWSGEYQTYLKLGNPENLKAGSSLLESHVSCVTSIVPTASGGHSFEHSNWDFNDGQNTHSPFLYSIKALM